MTCIFAEQLVPVELPCIVHMTFEEANRKRDVDNVESAKKYILDALVRSKILKDDSPKYVIGSPSYTRYDAKDGCRVLVTIIEDENEDRLRWKLRNASDTITEGAE